MDNFVSIIIITKGREEELGLGLKTILAQNYPHFEVIIINNGDPGPTFERIKKNNQKVKIIQNQRNLGSCISRNQGLRMAQGEYIWFLDDDVELLHQDYLPYFIDLLQNNPDIASIGGEFIKRDGKIYGQYARLMKTGRSIIKQKFLGAGEELKFNKGYLATCNCFVRMMDVQKAGGFYPDYFFYGEDKDLGYRILKMRKYHLINSKTLVLHKKVNKGFQRNPLVSNYLVNKNRVRFCIRNHQLKDILLLPLRDASYIFTGNNLVKRIMEVPFILIAYVWNIMFLPQTLKKKNRTFI